MPFQRGPGNLQVWNPKVTLSYAIRRQLSGTLDTDASCSHSQQHPPWRSSAGLSQPLQLDELFRRWASRPFSTVLNPLDYLHQISTLFRVARRFETLTSWHPARATFTVQPARSFDTRREPPIDLLSSNRPTWALPRPPSSWTRKTGATPRRPSHQKPTGKRRGQQRRPKAMLQRAYRTTIRFHFPLQIGNCYLCLQLSLLWSDCSGYINPAASSSMKSSK